MLFYLLNLFYAFFGIFNYIGFRIGVTAYLRHRKRSKTFIKKSKKGFANYWFYKKLHGELDLGAIYYLNLLLLIFTPMHFAFTVSCGWSDSFRFPIAVVSTVLCAVQIPSVVICQIYENYEQYGQAFVLLRRRENMGYDSSLVYLVEIMAMIAFVIYNFTIAI